MLAQLAGSEPVSWFPTKLLMSESKQNRVPCGVGGERVVRQTVFGKKKKKNTPTTTTKKNRKQQMPDPMPAETPTAGNAEC